MADFKNTTPDKLTICLLERERHDHIVKDAKQLGTKIKFISDILFPNRLNDYVS